MDAVAVTVDGAGGCVATSELRDADLPLRTGGEDLAPATAAAAAGLVGVVALSSGASAELSCGCSGMAFILMRSTTFRLFSLPHMRLCVPSRQSAVWQSRELVMVVAVGVRE